MRKYVGDSSEIEEDLEWTIEVLLGLKSGQRPTAAREPGGPLRPIRDFPLITFEGEVVPFSTYRGKVVLVDLWLLTSEIARSGIPRLQLVSERFRAQGLEVLGLHLDHSNVTEVKAFLENNHVTYPNFLASSEALEALGGLSLIPTLVLIDQEGVIRKRYETLSSAVYAEIDAVIVDLLKLAKPGERWVLGHFGPNGEWVEGHFEKAEP